MPTLGGHLAGAWKLEDGLGGGSGNRMGSSANAWGWSQISPRLFSLSDLILADLHSQMPALFWEISWEASSCCQLQGHLMMQQALWCPWGAKSLCLHQCSFRQICGLVRGAEADWGKQG